MPPLNDNFANATVISGASGAIVASNIGATTEQYEPPNNGYTVWFRWLAPATNAFLFSVGNSSFYSKIQAFIPGSNINPPPDFVLPVQQELVYLLNNSNGIGYQNESRIAFNVVSGQTYFIRIDGRQGDQGNFTLTWSPYYPLWLGSCSTCACATFINNFLPMANVEIDQVTPLTSCCIVPYSGDNGFVPFTFNVQWDIRNVHVDIGGVFDFIFGGSPGFFISDTNASNALQGSLDLYTPHSDQNRPWICSSGLPTPPDNPIPSSGLGKAYQVDEPEGVYYVKYCGGGALDYASVAGLFGGATWYGTYSPGRGNFIINNSSVPSHTQNGLALAGVPLIAGLGSLAQCETSNICAALAFLHKGGTMYFAGDCGPVDNSNPTRYMLVRLSGQVFPFVSFSQTQKASVWTIVVVLKNVLPGDIYGLLASLSAAGASGMTLTSAIYTLFAGGTTGNAILSDGTLHFPASAYLTLTFQCSGNPSNVQLHINVGATEFQTIAFVPILSMQAPYIANVFWKKLSDGFYHFFITIINSGFIPSTATVLNITLDPELLWFSYGSGQPVPAIAAGGSQTYDMAKIPVQALANPAVVTFHLTGWPDYVGIIPVGSLL